MGEDSVKTAPCRKTRTPRSEPFSSSVCSRPDCEQSQLAAGAGKRLCTSRASQLIERLRAAEKELWRHRSLLRQTERMAQVGGWETDLATHQMFWSDEIYRITELPIETSISVKRAMSFYPPEARQTLADAIARTLRDNEPFDLQLPYVTAKGSKLWVRTMGQTDVSNDRPTRVFGIFQDVTAQKAAETRIWHMANFDTLTGTANRSLLRQKLDAALSTARQQSRKLALLVLDLDGFKDVNDTFGHDAGDHVLRVQAERLKKIVRNGDIVARLGGDEFAVVLADLADGSDALHTTQRILELLREPIEWNGDALDCRCSVGVAMFPDHGTGSDELTKSADLALYKAKDDGKNACRVYSPSLRKEQERRTGAFDLCKDALSEDLIFPYYQPVIDLRSGRVSGFEALLRWRDTHGQIMSPVAIAEAFEDTELGCLLGTRMRMKTIRDMQAWHDDHVPFGRVGLNLCEPEFLRGSLADRILESLEFARLKTSDLVVEVTENALLKRSAGRALKELQTLKEAGVHVALDDFGTGASSLVHLQQFPVTAIKIDQSFVDKMLVDDRSDAIVLAIIGLGRQLGFDLVAEGIESMEQFDQLRKRDCPRGQGFLFGRAMSCDQVPPFLAAWKSRWQGLIKDESDRDRRSRKRLDANASVP